MLALLGGGPANAVDAAPLALPREADSFPQQWAYETSTGMLNTVCCSRRSGKTTGAVRRGTRVAALAQPGSWVHFGSLIRRNARKHFWRPFRALTDKLGWRYKAWENEMIAELPNGASVQAFGCDDSAGTKAVQGDGSVLFMVDECHLPNDDVLELLVDVATPMLTDRGGMLDLLGLPPEVEGGFFANALDSPGWRHFSWDMFCHDFPDPREVKRARVQEIIDRRGLTWDHPIIKRQYLGLREVDPSRMAYEYVKGRNDYDPKLVKFGPGCRNAKGLDLGFSDHDAFTALSWLPTDGQRRLFVRWAWQHNHLDVDDLAGVMEAASEAFPGTLVGDHGGHGATKVMETIAARLRTSWHQKPPDVMVSVGLVNDDLRTSRLLLPTSNDAGTALALAAHDKLVKSGRQANGRPRDPERDKRVRQLIIAGATAELAPELGRVTKTVNPRTKKVEINKRGFHSDLSESLRYGHHAARHFVAREPLPPKDHDDERVERWRARQKRLADPYRSHG